MGAFSSTSTFKGLSALYEDLETRTAWTIEALNSIGLPPGDVELGDRTPPKGFDERPLRIAWIGRTMAGKSTLFEAFANADRSRIGVGAQRTTLRPKEHLIRGVVHVDTPGVGALGGDEDYEIARAEAEKADALIWVVAESVPLEVSEAILLMAQTGKPIIIVFNDKRKIRERQDRVRYLRRGVMTRERDAVGHRKRAIWVLTHACAEPIEFVSVHAECALVSREVDSEHEAQELWMASNAQALADLIDRFVESRASTLRLSSWASKSETELRDISDTYGTLAATIEEGVKARQDALRKLRCKANTSITARGLAAKNNAQCFANDFDVSNWVERNAKKSSDELTREWHQVLESLNADAWLSGSIEQLEREVDAELLDKWREHFEDLSFDESPRPTLGQLGTTPIKGVYKSPSIAGDVARSVRDGLLGAVPLVEFPPIAIAVGLTTAVGAFIGRFFKRRSKIRSARLEAEKQLRSQVHRHLDEVRASLADSVEQYVAKMRQMIEHEFEKCSSQIDRTPGVVEELRAFSYSLAQRLDALPRWILRDAAALQGILLFEEDVIRVSRSVGFRSKVLVSNTQALVLVRRIRMPEKIDVALASLRVPISDQILLALGSPDDVGIVSHETGFIVIPQAGNNSESLVGPMDLNLRLTEELFGLRAGSIELIEKEGRAA